jgi:anthranilate phosphoribosyltransferase
VIQEAIALLVAAEPLPGEKARAVAEEILNGEATPSQIAAFVTALRIRGETVEHILAFVEVLRAHGAHVEKPPGVLLDTCGTGGDASGTFNVSTAAAVIASAAGVCVAKHGNRAVSSACGSADVLTQLGVNVAAPPEVSQRCLREIGLAFLFAPAYHPAMKHAAAPRREVGIRTIFNMIGPLSNPAGATHQLVGVYSAALTETFAQVLRGLGTERALVVHGADGLDEVTTTGPTRITELRDGEIRTRTVSPADFGVPPAALNDLRVASVEHAAEEILKVLRGEPGPRTDMALANAGAALYVAGRAPSLLEGCRLARETAASGKALEKLRDLIRMTNAA